jgi:hypothetical protein
MVHIPKVSSTSKLSSRIVIAMLMLCGMQRLCAAADLDAPRIVIDAPASGAQLRAPFVLHFEAAAGSQIDLSTFQVLYRFGLFTKDITDQIRPFVTLTPTGLTGSPPEDLQPGTHTLIIRIRDTKQREAEQTVSLRIGKRETLAMNQDDTRS